MPAPPGVVGAVLLLSLAVCRAGAAGLAIFGSRSGVTPPIRRTSTVWLYTSVASDYDGAALLPHFVKHYLDLGVRAEHFLVVVNHNPAKHIASAGDPVREVTVVLERYGIKYRLWLEQYSSEKLMKIRYEMLNSAAWDDWIIHADSDEFHDYGTNSVLKYLGKADAAGVNEIKGTYVDRVSASGELTKVQPGTDIFKQYPMKCQVIKTVAGGRDVKAMAYKGFWRTDRGNHQVLRPARAYGYLSGSPAPGAMSGRGVVDADDLYSISPYSHRPKAYLYQCQSGDVTPPGVSCQPDAKRPKKPPPKELLKRTSWSATVHHFKWHAGVVGNVQDRLQHYKGDARADGKPRYDWYKDSEKLLNGVVSQGRVDLKQQGCTS